MKEITILLDYKNRYSSKWSSIPYCSGMNKILLQHEFEKRDFRTIYCHYSDIDFKNNDYNKKIFLYTSSEDYNLQYKSYIEDVIYALEMQGAILLPGFKFLKAHHNKVFMEILRDLSNFKPIHNITSKNFGTLEDFLRDEKKISYPSVLKGSAGATSKLVDLIHDTADAKKKIKKISRSKALFHEIWDHGRSIKHKNYIKDSKYRNKFIIQNFIPNMNKDWKVLIFGDKFYVLERKVRKNDFRASGSGILSYNKQLPNGLLDYAEGIFNHFKIPFISLDIGYNENNFCLIEFQALHFGTHTIDTSPFYFTKIKNKWEIVNTSSFVEQELAESVRTFITKFYNN